jgi:hypothetical protein
MSTAVNLLRCAVHRHRLTGMASGSKARANGKAAAKVVTDSARLRQTQLRMSDELKDRIHEYQEQVKKKTGFEITFSVAVRTLIERGLEVSV